MMVCQSSVSLVKRRCNVMGYGRMDLLSMSLSDQSGTESAGHINTFETYLGQRLLLSRYPGQFAGPPAPRIASCCHWNVTLSSSWHRIYTQLSPLLARWLTAEHWSPSVHDDLDVVRDDLFRWSRLHAVLSNSCPLQYLPWWEKKVSPHVLDNSHSCLQSKQVSCYKMHHMDSYHIDSTCLLDLPFTFG